MLRYLILSSDHITKWVIRVSLYTPIKPQVEPPDRKRLDLGMTSWREAAQVLDTCLGEQEVKFCCVKILVSQSNNLVRIIYLFWYCYIWWLSSDNRKSCFLFYPKQQCSYVDCYFAYLWVLTKMSVIILIVLNVLPHVDLRRILRCRILKSSLKRWGIKKIIA